MDREAALSALLWAGALLLVLSPFRRSARMALLGLGLIAVAVAIPPRLRVVPASASALDRFAPQYQFHEIHRIAIPARREAVDRAVREVTAAEIRLFQTLAAIRRFGRSGPESILQAPEHKPLLAVATGTTFTLLANEPNEEIVFGSLVIVPRPTAKLPPEAYRSLDTPGYAKAAMNFRAEDSEGGRTLLTTETRVFATDSWTARRFAVYWRIIFPGSALIRYQWLQAIYRRTIKTPSSAGGVAAGSSPNAGSAPATAAAALCGSSDRNTAPRPLLCFTTGSVTPMWRAASSAKLFASADRLSTGLPSSIARCSGA